MGTACPEVAVATCSGGSLSVRQEGDNVILENEHVAATIDAAGTVVALGAAGGGDPVRIAVAAGVVARDAVRYERVDIVDQAPELAAVELTGGLVGATDVRVTTRYELRPCEDGLRARSELDNRSADIQTYIVADVSVWDTPAPELSMLEWATFPSVVVSRTGVAYGFVSCDGGSLDGVLEVRISALGTAPTLVRSGERLLFERFLLTAGDAAGAQAAIDEVRGR